MSKISIIGCGYVGLVSGAGLAEFGNSVVCIDIDRDRIGNLNKGIMPFYEPDLKNLVEQNVKKGRLGFSDSIKSGINDSDAVFIAVQTPQSDDGTADLKYLMAAAADLAIVMQNQMVVVIKSTVPVGTAEKVKLHMESVLKREGKSFPVHIVSNPEFLREGNAVKTFLEPDRIVAGFGPDRDTRDLIKKIYKKPVENDVPMIMCTNETAETIKYAANAFLAMKISYINQMAMFCEKTGADIQVVSDALGSDSRINPRFLNPGPGYGGSCFPKDTKALVKTAEKFGVDLSLVRTTDEANEKHKKILADKIINVMKDGKGKSLAVWGLSFKAGTGDMRNSPALTILPELCKTGIKINAYDPEASGEAERWLQDYMDDITIFDDMYDALDKADGLLILTEWDCFKEVDINKVAMLLLGNKLFDFRNLYDHKEVGKAGLVYYGIGRNYEAH